jgi:hypothetical protein
LDAIYLHMTCELEFGVIVSKIWRMLNLSSNFEINFHFYPWIFRGKGSNNLDFGHGVSKIWSRYLFHLKSEFKFFRNSSFSTTKEYGFYSLVRWSFIFVIYAFNTLKL